MFIYTITNAGYFCCNRLFCLFAFVFVVTDSFCLFVCFHLFSLTVFSFFWLCLLWEMFVCLFFVCFRLFLSWQFYFLVICHCDRSVVCFLCFRCNRKCVCFFFFLLWDLFHLFTRLSLGQIVVFGLDLSVKGAHARLHCPLIYQASHIAGLWVPGEFCMAFRVLDDAKSNKLANLLVQSS